jgi:polysaccharide biosynthesis protein VpsQ
MSYRNFIIIAMPSHRFWFFALWFYLGILAAISLAIYVNIIPYKITKIQPIDTIFHFFVIGFLAYIGHLSIKKYKIKIFVFFLPIAPIIVLFFSFIDEFIEIFIWGAGFDKLDSVADFCGIVFFTILAEKTNINKSSKKQI